MVIASMSYKGGVGKTTVAQNVSVVLANKGYKVCLVDADESQVSMMWAETRKRKETKPYIEVVGEFNKDKVIDTITELYETYDVVVVDCPPSYQEISTMIMLVSSMILIPITPTGKSEVKTATDFLKRYESITKRMAEKAPAYFVVNKYEKTPTLQKTIISALKSLETAYSVTVLESKLHKRHAYGEANTFGLGVYEYDNAKAKAEVQNLVEEVLAKS